MQEIMQRMMKQKKKDNIGKDIKKREPSERGDSIIILV